MEKNVIVKLLDVNKKFDDVIVIKDFSLDIYEGEFITLLGSSGCGKTTVLRIISGLEEVTSGKVFIDNKDVTYLDATKREVNTIFQNFALFPKMTVYENISFGLQMKKVNKTEINKRVKSIIKLVKLEGFENRYPHELSGGQQQRVAIARGVVMNPKVLLLDESLCSLDLKLKKSMQVELKRIQKELGITFIYVTHAQDEALSMSDRIAIINKGVIEQLGTPQEIYLHPSTVFVADFIGEANILDATVLDKNKDKLKISFMDNVIVDIKTNKEFNKDEKIKIVIRPEDVHVFLDNKKGTILGHITDSTYSGDNTKLFININDKYTLKATTTDFDKFKDGQDIYISFDTDYIEPLRK